MCSFSFLLTGAHPLSVPPFVPPASDPEVLDAICIRIRLEEVQFSIASGKFDVNDPSANRDPEPHPIYDTRGVRVNTKEKILLEKLQWERQGLVLAAQKINPQFAPPSDYKYQEQKIQTRVMIPAKEYPDYNFIGLIIGPRGMTQKQMEKDTNTKIAIRGRGSVKDGKATQGMAFDEPLHVLITAQNEADLKKAEAMVRKLVTPMEESKNDHKRAQLRKLAEINGTLREGRDDDIMGDQSERRGGGGSSCCRNCGATAHITYDCESKGTHVGVPNLSVREFFDNEYASFCMAVGEAVPSKDSRKR
jgi:splicing factor 1